MSRAVSDHLGMLLAERLRNVAVPANRPVRGHRLLQVVQRHFVPLNGLAIRVDQGWRMVMPVNFIKRLVTIGARLSRVPIVDDVGDQAGFRSIFDLREAFLSAAGFFGPARALA